MSLTVEELTQEGVFLRPVETLNRLRRLAAGFPQTSLPLFLRLLRFSPDPDNVVLFTERLAEEQPDAFQQIFSDLVGLRYAVTIFAYSRFLSEAVIRRPRWLGELLADTTLERPLSSEEFYEILLNSIGSLEHVPEASELAAFRRQQLLRIVLRDALGLGELSEIVEELSNLADAILSATTASIERELTKKYGEPVCSEGEFSGSKCRFTVIGLGKLGGRELNYSSDIDLMFFYTAPGETTGPKKKTNKEFYLLLASKLVELLGTYTPEGSCYRTDLRLRPEGRMGELCLSLDAGIRYYQQRARDWELQMLIKARPCAGDLELGRTLLKRVEPLIYQSTLDFSAVEAVSEARLRRHEQLQRRKLPSGIDIKLTKGGIRDIEFLVQCLQRLHGGRDEWVRHGGTLMALSRLHLKHYLSDAEYSTLMAAYTFLRHLEHRLQFYEDRQTHTLPEDEQMLTVLARKMPPSTIGPNPDAAKLLDRLNKHLEAVQQIYDRVIHAQQPIYYTQVASSWEPVVTVDPEPSRRLLETNLVRFLDQKAPAFAEFLKKRQLRRGTKHFEAFLEGVIGDSECLALLNEDPNVSHYLIDIFEHSVYFAEALVRRPRLILSLRNLPTSGPNGAQLHEHNSFLDETLLIEDIDELRLFFHREMFRIQARSICLCEPIFETLEQTSHLADSVIAAAYQLAIRDVMAVHPPKRAHYGPSDQLMVIALGRLGMEEFDLGSDADLVFVLPDEDTPELEFWTRVAERLIHLVTAYTGQGTIFAIDTRLRPNGREGALVQPASAVKEYFRHRAQAWEGITYMKSRAVAGNIERGTHFLNELQEIDWRRYGQSGRSLRELRQMRLRLEKEQGPSNPLKAGYGGYYDIDFILMYLRLKGGGIFYRVLNTPKRIEVIEKTGHLTHADAQFLLDAATFYRAVDHATRVYSGHSAGSLPVSSPEADVIQELVARWTPDYLHDEPLEKELEVVREKTRRFFNQIFSE